MEVGLAEVAKAHRDAGRIGGRVSRDGIGRLGMVRPENVVSETFLGEERGPGWQFLKEPLEKE
jgi:hypothetical protein